MSLASADNSPTTDGKRHGAAPFADAIDWLSEQCYHFSLRWKRRQFPAGVGAERSVKVGPVGLAIGRHSYANAIKVYGWQPDLEVTIGRYCSIAEDVVFLAGGEHDLSAVSTHPMFLPANRINSAGSVKVGHDVWIGHGAIILSGVVIGDGAVVAAGAVVTRRVPPYALVAGVPARTLRSRFDAETVSRLQRIAWWDWDEKVVQDRRAEFRDVGSFVQSYDPGPSS